jgi:hypothetical protein
MTEQNAQNNQNLALVPMNENNTDNEDINRIHKISSPYEKLIKFIVNLSMIMTGYYSYNQINSLLFHLISITLFLIGFKNLFIIFMKWYLRFYIREKANEILDFLIIEARKPNSIYIPQVKAILRLLRLLPPLENEENQ